MKNRRNYYRILRVQPDAPAEIIRASYRTLMRDLKQHPDLGGSTADAALLNEAYQTLSDPMRRAAYDKKTPARGFQRASSLSESSAGAVQPSEHRCPFCKTQLARCVQAGESCPTCKIPLPCHLQTDMDKASRRTITRMKKNGRILYCSSLAEIPKEAQMIDLSPKGLRFKCPEKLCLGTVLKIMTPQFTACGIVTNLHDEKSTGATLYAAGISFLAVRFEESKGSFISLSG